jgi:glycosyltransferase involved in cell wall biosynthesis
MPGARSRFTSAASAASSSSSGRNSAGALTVSATAAISAVAFEPKPMTPAKCLGSTPTPTKSSPLSDAGTKRYIRSTSMRLGVPVGLVEHEMSVDFSVVIPTYRRRKELMEAVASVCSQAEVSLEIIVVDDCPQGSAQHIVENLCDKRVIYFRNPEPTGGVPSIVRNIGWSQSRGIFIHFLDDDDVVPRGHYLAVKEAFETHPNVGLVFGRIEPFGVGPETQLQHERRYFIDAARKASVCGRFGTRWAFVSRMLFDQAILVCSAGIVRRECVTRIGGFDPNIRLMEDADFYTRVMRECGAYFLDRVALRYRIGSPSLMHSAHPTPSQLQQQRDGHRRTQLKYRKERGTFEFYSLAFLSRIILKVM